MSLQVRTMGIETPHSSEFSIDRPQGMGVFAFLQTLAQCDVLTSAGMEEMRSGECIIYTPDFPRILSIRPEVTNLRNNWIHFECTDPEALFTRLNLPLNSLFALRQPALITATLYDLMSERLQMNPHWEDMERLLLETLLVHTARNCMPRGLYSAERVGNDYTEALVQLRRKLYLNPERDWSVASMAESVFLTHNRFIALYRDEFGGTPKRDIMNARVQQAKQLLLLNSMSIRDVAQRAGFQNEYYFGNVFKRFTGMTPSEFRHSAPRGAGMCDL